MTDYITEAQEVRDEEQAVALIQRVLAEHLDAQATVQRVHEVLAALPEHVNGVRAAVDALAGELSAMGAEVATIHAKLDEAIRLFTEARDKAAGSEEYARRRLEEEREARKAAAQKAAEDATKMELEAKQARAQWAKMTAAAFGVAGGLYTAITQMLALMKAGGGQ